MKFNTIAISCGFALLAGTSFAGGLDRSTLSPSLLFQDGNAFQLGLTYVDPTVTGDFITPLGALSLGDMAENYTTLSLGYKYDLSDQISYSITLDTPYGANVNYSDANPATTMQVSEAELSAYRMTMLMKYKFSDNVSIYAGPVVEQIGAASVTLPGYTLETERSLGYGYAIGAAYEIPEYAMRLALTYTSEIEHDIDVTEAGAFDNTISVNIPQSVLLEAQTGLNDRTLLTGSIRWSEWSQFEVNPPVYAASTGEPLVSYENDSMAYSLGIGYKLTDQWALLGGIAYEAAQGGDASLLSPTDGVTTLSIGGQYEVQNSKLRFGVSYSMIGDASGTTASGVPYEFKDNSAIGLGLSYTHSF